MAAALSVAGNRAMANIVAISTLILASLLATQGCAGMFSAPRGGADTAVNFTLDGVAFRTFGTPVDGLQHATLTALGRMDFTLTSDQAMDDGRALVARAGDRTIHVELEKLTARTTRMRITAKDGWLWRDQATAGELLAQTERALTESPAVTRRGR